MRSRGEGRRSEEWYLRRDLAVSMSDPTPLSSMTSKGSSHRAQRRGAEEMAE
jgi:hypothetical protein